MKEDDKEQVQESNQLQEEKEVVTTQEQGNSIEGALGDSGKGNSVVSQQSKTQFIQCDSCKQWRRVQQQDLDPSSEIWYCEMNKDSNYNSCSIEQEKPDWEVDEEMELPVTYINKIYYKQPIKQEDDDMIYWISENQKSFIQESFDDLYNSLKITTIK